MSALILRRFYQRYLMALDLTIKREPEKTASAKRMALLLQATQWQIVSLSEEEYRKWN